MKSRTIWWVFAFAIMGVIMAFGFSKNVVAESNLKPTAVHRALTMEPDWLNVPSALTSEELAGRIILVDFWTFCCINCIHVIPDLHYLEQKFGDKLTVIGVHSAKFQNERDRENIRQAILRYDIEHPVVNDSQFHIWQNFAVRSWPTLILINPDGKIAEVYSGEGNRDALERDIADLIRVYGASVNTKPLAMQLEKTKQPKTTLAFPGKIELGADMAGKPALFISDSGNNRIVTTPWGAAMANADLSVDDNGMGLPIRDQIGSGKSGFKDGSFAEAQFNAPQGLLYRDHKLYIADTGNHALRVADLKNRTVKTLAGTGARGGYRISDGAPALKTALASPWDLAFYPTPNEIAIANAGSHQIWGYDIAAGTLRILAGNGRESIDDGKYPSNSLSQPSGLSVLDDKLYFVDSETSSLRVLQNGSVTTLIGTGLFDFGFKNGKQGEALLQHSLGLYATVDGVFIADSYNHAVRFYDFKTKSVSTVFGNGARGNGIGDTANTQFSEPNDIVKINDVLLIADTNNNRLVLADAKAGQSRVLDIKPAAAKVTLADPKDLPNYVPSKFATVSSGKSVAVKFDLASGWKINHDAPSYLDFFHNEDAVKSFDRAQIIDNKIVLPAMLDNTEYNLQGTIYFCEDKAGSICLIRSFHQKIVARPDSKELDVRLNLKP